MVGALPFGFLRLVGFVRSKYLPAGLCGPEGAAEFDSLSCNGKPLRGYESIIKSFSNTKKSVQNDESVASVE